MKGLKVDRCEFIVSEPPGYWHTHQCTRKSKDVIENVPLCGIHLKKFNLNEPQFLKGRLDAWTLRGNKTR